MPRISGEISPPGRVRDCGNGLAGADVLSTAGKVKGTVLLRRRVSGILRFFAATPPLDIGDSKHDPPFGAEDWGPLHLGTAVGIVRHVDSGRGSERVVVVVFKKGGMMVSLNRFELAGDT